MKNRQVTFQDWGLIDYKEAWDKQETLFGNTVALKTQIRNRIITSEGDELDEDEPTTNYLVFCEHPNVYTLGKRGPSEPLMLAAKGLKEKNAVYYPINRGGDIT